MPAAPAPTTSSPQHSLPVELLHPRHWPSWVGAGLLWVLAYLPAGARRGLGKQLGHLMYQRNHKRRRIIRINLGLCFPELSESEREEWSKDYLAEYAAALLDYSLLFFRSRAWLLKQIQLEGLEKLETALHAGQNVMLLLGHSVWLEFAPVAIGQRYPAYGSYKPFKNPVFDWLISRSRLQDVEFVVAREAGMLKLVKALQPGRLLFFLPDQDHGEKHSVFAPFFKVQKATLTTPARIARLGKAQCFPVMAFFDHEQGVHRVVISDALPEFGTLDAGQDAASMNQGFSALIAQHPKQYMWSLKLFRTRPDGGAPVYVNTEHTGHS